VVEAPGQLVEFRNYVLAAGAARPFVEHFERCFLASQEELGMDIVGQFTVPGDDARFVWVRRFGQPSARGAALRSFYTGPVWAEFGPRANELMVDHTDVHLLTPDPSGPSFAADHRPHARRAAPGDATRRSPDAPASTVVAAFYDLDDLPTIPTATAAAMTAVAAGAGIEVTELGRLVSAQVPNDFPGLPVHDAHVALWLLADHTNGHAATTAAQALANDQSLTLHTLHLSPTPRSSLH
jgi:hypothetical protein